MTFWQRIDRPGAMASRWRRKRTCELLVSGQSQMVALEEISGSEARVETHQPPSLGSEVVLHHPFAGLINGRVTAVEESGVRISFDRQEGAVAFALGAIVADMTLD